MKQRIYYLDLLRGFAILMVLLIHSMSAYIVQPKLYGTTSWYIYIILNAFARTGVPIFLMISGALLLSSEKTASFGKFYKKSLPRLIIPLLFWNAAYFVFNYLMGTTVFDVTLFFDELIDSGNEYHLWYLYTIIGIYLVAPFIKILVDRCTLKQLIWLVVLMLFGSSIRPFINTATPLYIYFFDPLFNGYIGCFLLGYLLARFSLKGKNVTVLAIVGVLGGLCSILTHHLGSSEDKINLVLNNGYSLCHYALAAAIFFIVRWLFKNRSPLKRALTLLSECSFGMYLTHVAVDALILKFIMIDAAPIVCTAYLFALSTAASFLISLLLGRIKFVRKLVQ